MKRVISLLLVIALTFCGCANRNSYEHTTNKEETTKPIEYVKAKPSEEMRAVWLSFYELAMKDEHGGSAESFDKKICKMFDNIATAGFNTVMVHVRAYSDAYYPSKIFPWSKYFSGTQGFNPGYDPLKIMVKEAKARKLSIQAWINPFRVSTSTNIKELPKNNPARIWCEDKDASNDRNVVVLDNGIFYNPASPQVHKLVIDGVREILNNYDVDGIHLDDYFYPSTDKKIDEKEYADYIKSGGKSKLDDWRRANIDTFVSGLYSAVKSAGKEKVLSISPAGNISNNYNSLYANISEWMQNEGYVDCIIPQLYFGFDNEYCPFEATAKRWSELATCKSVKVVWGLAVYKCGSRDSNAGKCENAYNEWKDNNDIIVRQIKFTRKLARYDGFCLFSYSYAFSENTSQNAKSEMQKLIDML